MSGGAGGRRANNLKREARDVRGGGLALRQLPGAGGPREKVSEGLREVQQDHLTVWARAEEEFGLDCL